MSSRFLRFMLPVGVLLVVLFFSTGSSKNHVRFAASSFDGERAYLDVQRQVSYGPRVLGSQAHQQAVAYILRELQVSHWETSIQSGEWQGYEVANIVAKKGLEGPWILIGAHYDSRFIADHDPDAEKRDEPVPGANDGASGVAVLLELARILPDDLSKRVWLVFFDAEDNGNIPGWEWIIGSSQFANSLSECPDSTVVIDMIGDQDLNIHYEHNSNLEIMEDIWSVAEDAGFGNQFVPSFRFSMLDDHTPFLNIGCKAADIIDFDFPAWHTTHDTVDKVSPDSLFVVGETLRRWLIGSE
jgi:glutaminyl-peptide cyclotransferase